MTWFAVLSRTHLPRAGILELREDAGAYFLAGVRLVSGMRLELLLEDGSWLPGRWQWGGSLVRWPSFRLGLGSLEDVAAGLTAAMPLPPGATLRFPQDD